MSKGNVELAVVDNIQIYIVSGVPTLIVRGDLLYPALTILYKKPKLISYFKTVIVDEGAVPHIVNGADVMVPGILEYSRDIVEGDIVIVLDRKRRPICIGLALMDSNTIGSSSRGRAIKNIHHIYDKVWDLCIKLMSS